MNNEAAKIIGGLAMLSTALVAGLVVIRKSRESVSWENPDASALSNAYDSFSNVVSEVVDDASELFNGVNIVPDKYKITAAELLRELEGFASTPYADGSGVSIGYGRNFPDALKAPAYITPAEGEAFLYEDIGTADNAIQRLVDVPLNDNQRAALVSFVYNVGVGAFTSSTMLRKINAGNIASASAEFPRWKYSSETGVKLVNSALVKRREKEQELFLT
jgi:lysozyme